MDNIKKRNIFQNYFNLIKNKWHFNSKFSQGKKIKELIKIKIKHKK